MHKLTKLGALSALMLTVCPLVTWAFQPLITDDTGTQGHGENQLEISFADERTDQSGIVSSARVLPLTYTRGLSDTLDISFGLNHTHLNSNDPSTNFVSGNGNPSLGLKWRFYENETSKTSLALKAELGLPIQSEQEALGLGSARTSYALTAILMQETGFGAILANLAATQTRYQDQLANPDVKLFRVSIAPVWQVNEQWKLALDLGSQTEIAAAKRTHQEFLEIGVVYAPDKDIDCALGLIGRNDQSTATSYAITGGVTWRFR